ncbi:MAG: hypothetical protein ACD_19C00079G0018 [uncultured bacterium]|nr:MAG: hypothetical protein ACD_19C00079G0018 [uncultured bacterium]
MNKKRSIAVLFGGVSPEHEVSIITALQVLEQIDREKFFSYAIKQGQDGLFYYYKNLKLKKDFIKIKPQVINFTSDKKGVYFKSKSIIGNKNYIDCIYLCFHGGDGESGKIQGFFDTLGVAYTSSNVEGSSISMNKVLTKEVLDIKGIKNVSYVNVFDYEIQLDVDKTVDNIKNILKLPVILKPAHLGSSIGINIAKTDIELKKYLLEVSHIDSEILVEKFMTNFVEYNISARSINGKIEVSEIEKPVSKDEILSFADKYQRGGKKTGGMASLSRELPAKINSKLKKQIEDNAINAYKAIRAKGLVRIDFMYSNKHILCLTEINPIPGSMAFYLWEASGISFKDQITDLVNEAIVDFTKNKSKRLDYKSDIVEKFISQ